MFNVGDMIQYGNSGVCKVEDITQNQSGFEKDRLYYLLVPVGSKGKKIYTPVNNEKVVMRNIMTEEQVHELMMQLPDIPDLWIPDERSREQCYKKALLSGNCTEWVQIIKTLYVRMRNRTLHGKKITSTDERYMKTAEDKLFSEIAVALGKDKEDVKKYFIDCMKKIEK